jgi:hypothetical protein
MCDLQRSGLRMTRPFRRFGKKRPSLPHDCGATGSPPVREGITVCDTNTSASSRGKYDQTPRLAVSNPHLWFPRALQRPVGVYEYLPDQAFCDGRPAEIIRKQLHPFTITNAITDALTRRIFQFTLRLQCSYNRIWTLI